MAVSRCAHACPSLLVLLALIFGVNADCGQDFKGSQVGKAVSLPPVTMNPGNRDYLVTVPDDACKNPFLAGTFVQACSPDSAPVVRLSDLKHATVHRTGDLRQSGQIYVTVYCYPTVQGVQDPSVPVVPDVGPVEPEVGSVVPVAVPVYN